VVDQDCKGHAEAQERGILRRDWEKW